MRLAYLASCLFGSLVCVLLLVGLPETLPPERRIPFSFSGSNPLLFMRHFRRGRYSEYVSRACVRACVRA